MASTRGGAGGTTPVTRPVGREAVNAGAPTLTDRVMDATLRCVTRWGVAKTTLDDIAREAACSRATIYRAFPGGRDSVLHATGEREIRRFLDDLAAALAPLESLEDLVTTAVVVSSRAIRHHEALGYLIDHEPAVVLGYAAFDGLDPLLTLAREFGAAELERHLTPEAAGDTAEWVARVVLAHAVDCQRFDLTDPTDAHRLVTTYLLPGLAAERRAGSAAA